MHIGMGGEIVDFFAEIGGLGLIGKIAPKAISAIHGAGAGRQEQSAIVVFPQQFFLEAKCCVQDGFRCEPGGFLRFQSEGDELAEDRIVERVLGDFLREALGELEGKGGTIEQLGAQGEIQFEKIGQGIEACKILPLDLAPKGDWIHRAMILNHCCWLVYR